MLKNTKAAVRNVITFSGEICRKIS